MCIVRRCSQTRQTQQRATHLLNVIVWNQALGLFLVLLPALLLCLPPVVIRRLLQHHQHVALGQGDLIVALGHVVVHGTVYAEKDHCVGGGRGAPAKMAVWYEAVVLQVMAVYNDAHKLGGGGRALSLHLEGLAGGRLFRWQPAHLLPPTGPTRAQETLQSICRQSSANGRAIQSCVGKLVLRLRLR